MNQLAIENAGRADADKKTLGLIDFYTSSHDRDSAGCRWVAPDGTSGGGGAAWKLCNSNATYVRSASGGSCVCEDWPHGYNPDTHQYDLLVPIFYNASFRGCVATKKIKAPGKPKNNGPQCPSCDIADPINSATGNNWRTETDFATTTGLSFSRTYNSNHISTDAGLSRSIGTRWTQPFDRSAVKIANPRQFPDIPLCYQWLRGGQEFCTRLAYIVDPTAAGVSFVRPDGKSYPFGMVGPILLGDSDVSDTVNATYASDGVTIDGWKYSAANGDQTESYDGEGKVLSVATRAGAVQTMTYSNGSTNDTATGRYPPTAPICPNVKAGNVFPAGLLLCVTDSFGKQIQFEYDASNRISKVLDPGNQSYLYGYDGPSGGCTTHSEINLACSANNLTQVTYPDGNTKTYWYNEATQINGGAECTGEIDIAPGFRGLLHALTSIVDENGSRSASWNYDCAGRAIANQLAGNVNQTAFFYHTPDDTGASYTSLTDTVGDPASPQSNVYYFGFKIVQGVAKIAFKNKPCAQCGKIASFEYDANANVRSSTDFNGAVTNYSYDLNRNLEISRTEAVNTAQARTITTKWHAKFRLPIQISETGRVTDFIYDTSGNLITKTITGGSKSRTWGYEYNAVGHVTKITGPRKDVADVTKYTYDEKGNLSTTVDALLRVTTYSNYDMLGRVGSISSPDGAVASLLYSPRGWINSRIVRRGGIEQRTLYGNLQASCRLNTVSMLLF